MSFVQREFAGCCSIWLRAKLSQASFSPLVEPSPALHGSDAARAGHEKKTDDKTFHPSSDNAALR
jgi:hypothetical protein